MIEQGTTEWLKSRLGRWNGSEVGQLIGTPRTKSKQFTDTAMKYINKVRAERALSWLTLGDELEMESYFKRVDITNKAMQWGHDHEDEAAQAWKALMEDEGHTIEMKECESMQHQQVAFFSASPDRLITVDGDKMVLEIKCPHNPVNAFIAMDTVKDWESLKEWNSQYYWQVVAEIACSGSTGAYFTIYDPMLEETVHTVRLERDEVAEMTLINKIIEAEEYIKTL